MIFFLVFLLVCCNVSGDQLSTQALCDSFDAQQSCGQCIKSHVDCTWCIDPNFKLKNRCQLKSNFTEGTCASHFIYSSQLNQIQQKQNLPLGSKQPDEKTFVILQPQAVYVRLMPGHSSVIKFKYLHKVLLNQSTSETMEIQTSKFQETQLKLKFYIFCDGEFKETKSCRVQNNQIVEFQIELFANACSKTGDITLSVGILGQRTISGVYISTICGCECEKHPEINSKLCHEGGHLVCGQCVCNSHLGGSKCECPLSSYGVSTAIQLEDKCKQNVSSALCSSSGECQCGQCKCSKPSITGKFCECKDDICPVSKTGKQCSGNGDCMCGMCKCYPKWTTSDCSCLDSDFLCIKTKQQNEYNFNLVGLSTESPLDETSTTIKLDEIPLTKEVILPKAYFVNFISLLLFTVLL